MNTLPAAAATNTAAHTPVTPSPAASVVLVRKLSALEVFWVKRAAQLKFLAGFHAFPGGACDDADATISVEYLPATSGHHTPASYVCAVREVFEETGVLLVRGAERLDAATRRAARTELLAGALNFADWLAQHDLAIDARLLEPLPCWVTPATMARRFDTRFFLAWLPAGQEVEALTAEAESGEWIAPQAALQRWTDGEALIVTPTLSTLYALAEGATALPARLQVWQTRMEALWEQRVEMRRGMFYCALRTPTIPPATHTNCYFVGEEELVVIDPGSPYPDEQARLDAIIAAFLAEGRRIREILITHLHPDHIGGVRHLQQRFQLPVATHALTAAALDVEFPVQRLIADDEVIELRNTRDALTWRLRALWTPGHARGHLSFYEERTGTLLTGDCVVGLGTVVIAPPEGNLRAYLASLERYLTLPKLTALFPGHGPVVASARERIEEYIAHRHAREAQIIAALHAAPQTIPAIVKTVYQDVAPSLHALAELSVRAHLEKLQEEQRVQANPDQTWQRLPTTSA